MTRLPCDSGGSKIIVQEEARDHQEPVGHAGALESNNVHGHLGVRRNVVFESTILSH